MRRTARSMPSMANGEAATSQPDRKRSALNQSRMPRRASTATSTGCRPSRSDTLPISGSRQTRSVGIDDRLDSYKPGVEAQDEYLAQIIRPQRQPQPGQFQRPVVFFRRVVAVVQDVPGVDYADNFWRRDGHHQL